MYKNYVILKVTNDEFEFVLDLYESFKDMMKRCNIAYSTAVGKLHQPTKAAKWVLVFLDD